MLAPPAFLPASVFSASTALWLSMNQHAGSCMLLRQYLSGSACTAGPGRQIQWMQLAQHEALPLPFRKQQG